MRKPVSLTETITHASGVKKNPDSTMLIRIIDAGEGSSAIYPPQVLEQAAPLFKAGTHMYVDHANNGRRGVHGERSLRDLASVLTTDAYYDQDTKSLVAEIAPIPGQEAFLESVREHCGLSISATAFIDPPAKDGELPVVTEFESVESVDWVVAAGRGGKVLALLESARTPKQVEEVTVDVRREQLEKALRDVWGSDDKWVGVRDFDETTRIVYFWDDQKVWSQSYMVDADDLSVTLTGARTEVRATTIYVPVQQESGGATIKKQKEGDTLMNQTGKDVDRVATLESELAAAKATIEEMTAHQALVKARETAAAKAREAAEGCPTQMVARIVAAVEAQINESELPPDLDQRIQQVIETEKTYVASLSEGKITGFGESAPISETSKNAARTVNAFGRKLA